MATTRATCLSARFLSEDERVTHRTALRRLVRPKERRLARDPVLQDKVQGGWTCCGVPNRPKWAKSGDHTHRRQVGSDRVTTLVREVTAQLPDVECRHRPGLARGPDQDPKTPV